MAGQLANRTALVTGASSGLGMELARELAARKINLILTARREAPMQQLAEQLKQQHSIEIIVEPIDLAEPGSAATLQNKLDQCGIEPTILINNAGFGISSAFIDQAPDRLRSMLQLNIVSLTELTHVFGKRMADQGGGHILLVASTAAYQPTPMLAAYGATKAFVLSLGEALNVEFGPKIGVTVLSPGLMDTGFNDASGYKAPDSALIRKTKLPSVQVARIGIDAMFAGKPSVIAGRLNKIMSFSSRLTSRHFQAKTLDLLQKSAWVTK